MEQSMENWHLHSELDIDEEVDEFLREILLQQPPQGLSPESENDCYNNSFQVQNDTVSAAANDNINTVVATNGTNTKTTTGHNSCSLSPKRYILSFDNSTMIPATPETCVDYGQPVGKRDSRSCSKRSRESQKKSTVVKTVRSGSQTTDHIMAERKRRQELTEKFIALSATIPGLSKTDKTSVLGAAIDYVKHLQERVEELEKHDKKDATSSVIVIKKPELCDKNIEDMINTSSVTSYDHHDYSCNNNINILPEIKARVMGKEVLIELHCEKEIGIELKLLNHVENLQLFVTGTGVLPFGNSALSVTIIAKMGEKYKLTMEDLVKSLSCQSTDGESKSTTLRCWIL